MKTLHARLEQVGYRLTTELADQVTAALHTRPCPGSFLNGAAGAGKTFLAESVARVEARETFFFQAFPGCRKEELYQTILPDAGQPSGFRTLEGVLPQAAQASLRGPTALILDEWDKTHPSTDAFLLDFLQTGRISIPGSRVTASQEQLVVFITLNDERELSEPLLRRLPMIELRPAPASLVAQALGDTHAGHPWLPAAVSLYRRSRLVNLSKPVTIQELRQLLDAISHLGASADWNRLVFQFVSKGWDDHELLKSAEAIPLEAGLEPQGAESPELDVARYEGGPVPREGGAAPQPRMPRVRRDWLDSPAPRTVEAEDAQVYGVVPRTDSGYDGVARAVLEGEHEALSISDPADLKIAQVGDSEIIVFEPLDFARVEQWGLILKDGGELLLEARHGGEITLRMLRDFRAGQLTQAPDDPQRCRIYSLTDDELLMRYREIKIRWSPATLEVVTNDFEATHELWDFLYGVRGRVSMTRMAQARQEQEAAQMESRAPVSHQQLREDYLLYLKEYRHLRHLFSLFIARNLQVWGRITCTFQGRQVKGSTLPAPDFFPDSESPATKEEAEAIAVFIAQTQPALDCYESQVTHIESDLTLFVAKNGEFPPAVEDGGIFALHEIHSDLQRIKREGLKLYMRKGMREA